MPSISRRSFLSALGVSLTAAKNGWPASGLEHALFFDAPRERPASLGHIGVQLYTVRSEMRKDVGATLARVARIGYREVEFAGYFGKSAAELREMLAANGLTAPSAHLQIDVASDQYPRALDDARTIGHEYVIVAWLDAKKRATLGDLERTADAFNKAAETAKSYGLKFGYHNHDFEFKPVEGRMPMDVLLAATDPKLVAFQMDLYWIIEGGGDPLAYFAKYPGRFPMVHVKDMMADAKHTMVDVGKGSVDWKKIFAARATAGIQRYIVEHDEPADPFASIKASYDYLKALSL